MNHWFTRAEAPLSKSWVKRFDPLHWTVDFPRGALASIVTGDDGHSLRVEARFLRASDLVGLIFESEDRHAHAAHRRETNRDYSGCVLSFRWQSTGLIGLDAGYGPTLTVEGRDEHGVARAWYVRLWNYVQPGAQPADARIRLDFDALDGGYSLPADAQRVWPKDIDRMFISLVGPAYPTGSPAILPVAAEASVTLSEVSCSGPGSVLAINDAVAPEHGLSICTAYDDLYHLPPRRVVEAADRLGYRGPIVHYVGMSHVMALGPDGKVVPMATDPMAGPARSWHRALAREARKLGRDLIWSISFELLDQYCPDAWKQRSADGTPALTDWSPPSALLSPANGAAMTYLQGLAAALVRLSLDEGLEPKLQLGEAWWWVKGDDRICLYDDAARLALGGNPAVIADVKGAKTSAERAVLDAAGAILAGGCASIIAAARAVAPATQALLLVYLPSVMRPDAPELRRANAPTGWAFPAYDVMQIEDYEWVTGGRTSRRRTAVAEIEARLGYGPDRQHYLAGFVLEAKDRGDWERILAAAGEAQSRGVEATFIWSLPQVLRDGLTIFGEENRVIPFDDVDFPIAIGAEASVAPSFSTEVITSASGREWRNANWSQARLRFDAGPGVRSESEMRQLIAFFRARRGPATAFRFRDPFDSTSATGGAVGATDQLLGLGDAVRTEFALVKHYGAEERRITRPVAGSVRVAIDGAERASGWTVEDGGLLVFDVPPPAGAQVTAGFEFDVPVRFAEDRLEVNRVTFLAGEAPSVPLVEVREDFR